MEKLVIFIETPEDETALNDEWPLFLFLAERMPGLVKETTGHVEKMVYGAVSYSRIHELYFNTMDDLKKAMASEEGRLAGAQLQKMTHGRLALMISDHNEDSLERLQPFKSQNNSSAQPG
jgi:uncharacterized protein (TIGR02118 family)